MSAGAGVVARPRDGQRARVIRRHSSLGPSELDEPQRRSDNRGGRPARTLRQLDPLRRNRKAGDVRFTVPEESVGARAPPVVPSTPSQSGGSPPVATLSGSRRAARPPRRAPPTPRCERRVPPQTKTARSRFRPKQVGQGRPSHPGLPAARPTRSRANMSPRLALVGRRGLRVGHELEREKDETRRLDDQRVGGALGSPCEEWPASLARPARRDSPRFEVSGGWPHDADLLRATNSKGERRVSAPPRILFRR